jgi:hypothetical protein
MTNGLTSLPRATATVGPHTFTRVIPINARLNLETAKGMTAHNGYDEVFLQTDSGKLYAAVGPGGKMDLRTGYVGMVNGEQARVVHVDDEVNSAGEGARTPFRTMGNLFSSSTSTAVTAMISTTVGGMMAGAAVGAPSAVKIGQLAKTAGGAFRAAGQRLAISGAVGLGVTAVVMGTWSAIGAMRGTRVKTDDLTLQMLR